MKKRITTLLLLTLPLLATTLHAQDAAIRNMEGQVTSLQNYMEPDKWTVVMIWASRCHVCNEEAPQYSAFHTKHADKDIKIVGISIDGDAGLSEAQSFISRHQLNYPNLIGDTRTVAALYQEHAGEPFRATPTFMVFDPSGQLQAAQAGGISPKAIEDFIDSKS